MPFGGEGYGEQGGGAVWRPQGAREEARIDAGCKKRRGLRMPAGRDGATGLAEPGALFGAPEGALDTGATPRGGGRRTLSWGAPRGRQEPGPVPVRVPGGAEPREGLGGQRDVAVLGALAAVDMALEARALARGALQAEGCLAAESQARDRGEGDLGMQGGGGQAELRALLHTADRGKPVGGLWAKECAGVPVAREDVLGAEAHAAGAEAHGRGGQAVDLFAVQDGALQRLCREAGRRFAIALSQQADGTDRGFLGPFALATAWESRQHVVTQWGQEISPFVH